MSETGIGASVKRVSGRTDRSGQLQRRYQPAKPDIRLYSAQLVCACNDQQHQYSCSQGSPGVVAVFTGEDMQVGSIPCGWQVHSKNGDPMAEPGIPRSPKAKSVMSGIRSPSSSQTALIRQKQRLS